MAEELYVCTQDLQFKCHQDILYASESENGGMKLRALRYTVQVLSSVQTT